MSQLFKSIDETKLSEMTHRYIIGEDDDGKKYTKVISETPKPFFQYRIQQENINFAAVPKTPEEKKILAAYKFFERNLESKAFLSGLAKKFPDIELSYVDALRLFRDQILKCKVIYVTVNSVDDAYAIFEVLNAKGKNLTPVDMIKNTVFSILDQQEPIDTAHEKWGNIRGKIAEANVDDIMTFYRHFWLSKYGLAPIES